MAPKRYADGTDMQASKPARFLRVRLRWMLLASVLLIAEGALLAFGGFWWWPLSLLAIAPIVLLGRATVLGGPLDPVTLRSGIRGEEHVADVLAVLEDEGFTVVHDLDTGRGDVDHLLVGPTGVFVIETKDWGGRFYRRGGRLMFNDKPADQVVGQVTAAALAIRDGLLEAGIDVWVQAIIASTRAKVSTGVLRLGHVTIADADRLPEIVRASKGSLDAETVSRAFKAILHDAA
jgi:hypothetical protein